MARRGAVISIDINAGTAKMIMQLQEGKAAFQNFGGSVKSAMAPTSVALRELEGNIANNNRGAARFLADTLKLGPALAAAFPVFGAVAFGGVVVETGKKIYEFFKNIQEQPGKIASAFRELNAPMQLVNDGLEVANVRLAMDIAKLQGKPVNNLQLALAEDKEAADKLAEALEKDLAALQKLLQEQSIGRLSAFFTGRASTASDEAEIKRFQGDISKIESETKAKVRAAKTEAEAQAARDAGNKRAQDAIEVEIEKYKKLVEESQKLKDLQSGQGLAPVGLNNRTSNYQGFSSQDVSGLLAARKGTLENLLDVRDHFTDTVTNTRLKEQKTAAEQANQDKQTRLHLDQELAAAEGEHVERLNQEGSAAERLFGLNQRLLDIQSLRVERMKKIDSEEKIALDRLDSEGQRHKMHDGISNEDEVKQTFGTKRKKALENELAEMTNLANEQDQLWKRAATESEAVVDKQIRPMFERANESVREGTKTLDENAKAHAKWAAEVIKPMGEVLKESERHELRMAEIRGSATNPLGALAEQERIRREYIDKRYELEERNRNVMEKQALEAKKAVDLENLRNDMEERRLSISRQQFDQALSPVIGGFSAQLADLMTGKKTTFGKTFEGLGHSALQSGMEKGLHFGIDKLFGGAKRGDSPMNPLWVQTVGSVLGGGPAAAAGGIGGFFAKLFGKTSKIAGFGGGTSGLEFMADGGDIDPGRSYIVGDGGEPELFTPRTAGSITPMSKMGGSSFTYHIDARGAALGVENRIARGIEAAHNSAVATATRAMRERTMRTPQRRG